ncbi:MAG: DEAD/DEAH box helicase [Mariprofundales bacterium]|nr:DEAD/DEAH box helicase [Mariprofundales bacterium]
MTIPAITVPLLRQHLNAAYLRRGKIYSESGTVTHFHLVDDSHLRGAVQGSDPEPYEITITFGDHSLKGECTCPVGFNCKHVAALLYMLRDQQQQAETDDESEQEAPATPFDNLLSHLSNKEPALSSANIYPPQVRQRILYLIQPTTDGKLALYLRATHLLTSGGYGALASYAPDNILRRLPRFVLAIDQLLMQSIMRLRHARHHHYVELEGEAAIELLHQALASERCHYLDHNKPPLMLADSLPANWQWQMGNQGEQRLVLNFSDQPNHPVLPLIPPHYIDIEQGHCGPIDCEIAPATAAKLLQMPTVAAENQESIFAELIPKLPPQIPQPIAVISESRFVMPTPVLELFSQPPTALQPNYTTGGNLSFDYGGTRIRGDDDHEALCWREGETLVRCRRDHGSELQARSLLVRFGMSHFPPPRYLQKERIPEWVMGTDAQWFEFVTKGIPKLKDAAFEVIVEAGFRFDALQVNAWDFSIDAQGLSGHASLTATLESDESLDLIDAISNWVQEDPDRLSDEALAELELQKEIYLPLTDGRWLAVPSKILHSILHHMMDLFNHQGEVSGAQWLALHSELEEQKNIRFQQDHDWLQRMRRLVETDTIPAAALPFGLKASLRDYQHEGLNWLQFLRQMELGGILADDMGLGKTVQTLTHILLEKEEGRLTDPALVVAPTSLMHNWRAEAARFTPDLSVLTLHGADRAERFDKIAQFDIVLTTYPLLSRDYHVLSRQHYHLLILDEAQQVKNPRAKAAQLVRTLDASHRLCLTGTPMENHLGELWAQFDFLMPGYLYSQRGFNTIFRKPIERDNLQSRQHLLNLRVRPFMLRRSKDEVAKELPPKTEIERAVEMEDAQQRLYESVRLAMQKKVRDSVATMGMQRSHIIVLDALLKMRQVCCDPRLLKQESAQKVPSAKLNLLRDMMPEMISEGRHILLFSQFTQMLKLIEAMCIELKISYVKLTGNTRDRVAPIETFQAGKVPLFLISLKAGGTGLNLTAADTVIHYDPWWNPAVEDQATDRAHRIGQQKSVFVYKLITAGTVEERIVQMQQRKRELAQSVHRGGQQQRSLWTSDELDSLFAPLEETKPVTNAKK